MYPHRSEHSRQYSDRSSRQWEDYDERRERRDPHRDKQWDSNHNYGGDGHGRTERISSERLYGKDSLNRERSRKSPVRRRMSSPNWSPAENKRRRFTENDKDDYRYRPAPEEKASRQSPDSFPRAHATKDFKRSLPREKDFEYNKTTQDSRHRYKHEEFTYRQQHDDLTSRRSSEYYKERNERSWDRSPGRTRSQDHVPKNYVKSREKNDSPTTNPKEDYHHHHHHHYIENDVAHQSAAVPEQKTTKGFQRFLDVLNKGVNVDVLTKIVTSTKVEDRPHSPTAFADSADRPWSPSFGGRQHTSHRNACHWSESEASQRQASPQPRRGSLKPTESPPPDEKSLQRAGRDQSHFNDTPGSPLAERMPLTPEDEHKRRHMQDVLQAIGMNLGFEELGQMSHRIQERLYGKKDGDGPLHLGGSSERETRRASPPRPQNRSSSSRSSFSPPPREYYAKEDSYSSQRDAAEDLQAHDLQAVDYSQSGGSSSTSEKCETNSQESAAAASPAFSQTPSFSLSALPPAAAAVLQKYSPVNCSPRPYPAMPPILPHVGPRIFMPHLPRLPPFVSYPPVPPLNMFPGVFAQTRQLLPQHAGSPQPIFNLPPNNSQKPKTVSRPRCLQVIQTKQPG